MTRATQGLGRLGEDLALQALLQRGYALVARNARPPGGGELDLVARDGACWVFVEVRCRRGAAYGTPEETFTARKRARLEQAARAYLDQQGVEDAAWRVDFVAVELTVDGRLVRVEWIENVDG